MYFPPNGGSTWDTLAPSTLGWCQDSINALYQFLDDRDSKSFMVLKDGKIVLERYFGTYTVDSIWFWASCSKSLAAYLVGIAQEEGHLNINDKVSDYLGQGWTSASQAQEDSIRIVHQIAMTTGLDENVPDNNCLIDSCLNYLAPVESRWAYYNAPYRLVQDVVVNATSSLNINQYTNQKIAGPIGMGGFWFNYVRWGGARDMARFGLLALNNGVWAGNTILGDSTYLYDMVHTANAHNEAYGYLWWLNGTNSYMQPGIQFAFPGSYAPSAPADMYAALGKNDQKIYVVPSLGMVVVRQGGDASTSPLAISSFDEELWHKIMNLNCTATQLDPQRESVSVGPNPASDQIHLTGLRAGDQFEVWSLLEGKQVLARTAVSERESVDVSGLARGLYSVRIFGVENVQTFKILLR